MHVTLSVDALTPNLGGIGRYCWELASRIGADPRVDNVAYSLGAGWIEHPERLVRGSGTAPTRRQPWRNRFDRWWHHSRFVDRVYHAPNYFLPDWAEGGVATIHDLSVFKFPETHPVERIKAFEANFSTTIKRAGLILTDCEWMREEVIAFTGLPRTRVQAIPLGVSPEFRPRSIAEIAPELAEFNLPIGEYGLCVSTLEPRKRIDKLLHAWKAMPEALRNRHPLILAGGAGWCNDALMAQIERGQQEGWLRYLGYVPEARLPALYAGARVFAYPSQYEGFGFPPLEAMASGVPTLVSGSTCLEEVAGAGAVVADPEDIPALCERLSQMLEPGEWREQLSSGGIQITARYSWSACIELTVGAYRSILQEST